MIEIWKIDAKIVNTSLIYHRMLVRVPNPVGAGTEMYGGTMKYVKILNWTIMYANECAFWMKHRYPVTIIADRYHGSYSGAEWLAFPLERDEVPEEVCGDDMEEMTFWDDYKGIVGKGTTPDEALANLTEKVAEIAQLSSVRY